MKPENIRATFLLCLSIVFLTACGSSGIPESREYQAADSLTVSSGVENERMAEGEYADVASAAEWGRKYNGGI